MLHRSSVFLSQNPLFHRLFLTLDHTVEAADGGVTLQPAHGTVAVRDESNFFDIALHNRKGAVKSRRVLPHLFLHSPFS